MTATHQLLSIGAAVAFLAAGSVTQAASFGEPAPKARATPPALPVKVQVIEDERYRAVFCGEDGTETSAPYARTLVQDLRRLERTGLAVAEALARIEDRACAAPRPRP